MHDALAEADLLRERLEHVSGISRASVKTASWLPASGVSVKTSATTLRKAAVGRL